MVKIQQLIVHRIGCLDCLVRFPLGFSQCSRDVPPCVNLLHGHLDILGGFVQISVERPRGGSVGLSSLELLDRDQQTGILGHGLLLYGFFQGILIHRDVPGCRLPGSLFLSGDGEFSEFPRPLLHVSGFVLGDPETGPANCHTVGRYVIRMGHEGHAELEFCRLGDGAHRC